jgi:hypothetical protein
MDRGKSIGKMQNSGSRFKATGNETNNADNVGS